MDSRWETVKQRTYEIVLVWRPMYIELRVLYIVFKTRWKSVSREVYFQEDELHTFAITSTVWCFFFVRVRMYTFMSVFRDARRDVKYPVGFLSNWRLEREALGCAV